MQKTDLRTLIRELTGVQAVVRGPEYLNSDTSRSDQLQKGIEVLLKTYESAMAEPGTALAGLALARSCALAKDLLVCYPNFLYEYGYLERVFKINPDPYLLSHLFKNIANTDDKLRSDVSKAAIKLGGCFNDSELAHRFESLSEDLLLKLSENILTCMDIYEAENDKKLSVEISNARGTIARLLLHVERKGFAEEVIRFLSKHEALIDETDSIVSIDKKGLIQRYFDITTSAQASSLIKKIMPGKYEQLLEVGAIRDQILVSMFADSFDFQQSTYLDAISPEDIVGSFAEQLKYDNIVGCYQKFDRAFSHFGVGSFYDALHENELVSESRELAIRCIEQLERCDPHEVISNFKWGSVSRINNYLMLDMLASKPEDQILKGADLKDKWAELVLLSTFVPNMTSQIPPGPRQSERLLTILAAGLISPGDIPQPFLDSDVFRKKFEEISDEQAKAILERYGNWDYARTIRFSSNVAKRHLVSIDMGL